ncbi:TPA: hypothetical protein QBH20_004221 [Escherichia coli]|nr:hypothetical protein [Escherichia coli]
MLDYSTMRKRELSKKINKGLSLIEAAIFLVVSAAVISAALFFYNSTKERKSISEGTNAVQNIVAAVNKLYAGSIEQMPASSDRDFMASISSLTGLKLNNDNRLVLPSGNYVEIWGVPNHPRTYAVEISESSGSRSACVAYASLNFGPLMKRRPLVSSGGMTIDDAQPGGALTPAEATDMCNKVKISSTRPEILIRYFFTY